MVVNHAAGRDYPRSYAELRAWFDHRPSLKGLALDVGVSVGVVAVLYLVFTWVLVVQLPEFAL